MASGRNEPCPCGSGKKYKKCCLAVSLEGASSASAGPTDDDFARASRWLALDRELVAEILTFGTTIDGWSPATEFPLDIDEPGMLALFGPWAAYEYRDSNGRSTTDHFVASHEEPSREATLLVKAQLKTRLTMWEVLAVDAGRSVRIRDLLRPDRERLVTERRGTMTMTTDQGLLGRVLDLDGISVFCGTHPQPLPRAQAHDAANELRRGLMGSSERPLDERTLNRRDFGNLLLNLWHVALAGNLASA